MPYLCNLLVVQPPPLFILPPLPLPLPLPPPLSPPPHLLPLTVQLHCRAVPVHSLAAALRLCSRVASPSAGV